MIHFIIIFFNINYFSSIGEQLVKRARKGGLKIKGTAKSQVIFLLF
jgi:hypothetical protein